MYPLSPFRSPAEKPLYLLAISFDFHSLQLQNVKSHRKLGSILSENVILTEYAPDLSKRSIIKKNNEKKKVTGHIVFVTVNVRIGDEIRWRKTINLSKNLPPGPFDPQIALIKLNRNITLTPDTATPFSLPAAEPKAGSKCSVIGWTSDSFERLVEYQVNVLNYNECKKRLPSLHENALCVELTGKDHCKDLHGGDALLCDGILTCVLSHNDQCDKNQPRPCASLFTHRDWIESTIKELDSFPPVISRLSSYSKHLVIIGWYENDGLITNQGFASILSDDAVLTSYATEFDSNMENALYIKRGQSKGYLFYNFIPFSNVRTGHEFLVWNSVFNVLHEHQPSYLQPQIAIIKLNPKLKLNEQRTAILPLPFSELEEYVGCVTFGLKDHFIIETDVVIIEPNECLKFIPRINHKAICIDIPEDSSGEEDHCKLFTNGAPVICNGYLLSIVSWEKPCDPYKPRISSSVYIYKDWIINHLEENFTSLNNALKRILEFQKLFNKITQQNCFMKPVLLSSKAKLFYSINSQVYEFEKAFKKLFFFFKTITLQIERQ
uniref:Peptidase S1 domain-containing protein n=1 Tax=Glossina brevipalpis TaxID=37001 RepID=A0A1A9WY01_9MUSC